MRRIQCNAKQFNPGIGPALKYDRPALKYDRLTLKEGEGGEEGKGGGRLYIITITSSSTVVFLLRHEAVKNSGATDTHYDHQITTSLYMLDC